MDSKKSHKIAQNYECKICDYNTSNKFDYSKHLTTDKHKSKTNDSNYGLNDSKKSQKIARPYTCGCGKVYVYDSGYYRHRKTCLYMDIDQPDEPSDKQLIMLLIKENNDLKTMVLDVCKQLQPLTTNAINSYNTNSHNKTFNLNVFLNEYCKDAMNITDFVDSLKLQVSDLENVGRVGFVNGISNIIIKNLNSLEETKRPIHCTDAKRETIYIKDQGIWEKDTCENEKLRKAIKHIAYKNTKLIPEFKAKHPDCIKSESNYSDQYNKLVIEAFGGKGDDDKEKEDKIIKKIAKEIMIEKDNYLT